MNSQIADRSGDHADPTSYEAFDNSADDHDVHPCGKSVDGRSGVLFGK